MLIKYLARRIAEALDEREQRRRATAEWDALPKEPCLHCGGDGEVRVRGVRTVTGYEMCFHCGGLGEVAVKP